MIIAMAGLPGTGKSALARALADLLPGALLEKDHIRSHLFPAEWSDYSREQDDFCFDDVMLRTTAWLLDRDPGMTVLLDGRTLTRAPQVTALRAFAAGLHQDLVVIECACSERIALARLAECLAKERHRFPRVDAELYYTLKERAEPVPPPKIVIDTAQPVRVCAALALGSISRIAEAASSSS